MKEEVNHPERYGGDTVYECIKVLEAWLPPEQYKGSYAATLLNTYAALERKIIPYRNLKKLNGI